MAEWFFIPARGGSLGVSRKNTRILGGKPLLAHALDTVLSVAPSSRVIVITDDDEIASLADARGARALLEPPADGTATLDEVICRALLLLAEEGTECGDEDTLITVQPTCPFLRRSTLERAVEIFRSGHNGSLLTVIDDRHLRWKFDSDMRPVPAYERRVNRAHLAPLFRETGGIIAAKVGSVRRHGTRIVEPVVLLPLDRREGLDINDEHDWIVAEAYCREVGRDPKESARPGRDV